MGRADPARETATLRRSPCWDDAFGVRRHDHGDRAPSARRGGSHLFEEATSECDVPGSGSPYGELGSPQDTVSSEGAALAATKFEIVVKGSLSPALTAAIEGFEVARCSNGQSHLVGWVPDTARLHGIMERLQDLNIELVSINPLASA